MESGAVLFLFMLCKTDDKAESESYWASLIAAAIQQAELVARVCAQCLFTAGCKDPAGIVCHSPQSTLQKRKGSVTFNLPPFSLPLGPRPTRWALLRLQRGERGCWPNATVNKRVKERGEEAGTATAQDLPLTGQSSRLNARGQVSSSKGKKRGDGFAGIPFWAKLGLWELQLDMGAPAVGGCFGA